MGIDTHGLFKQEIELFNRDKQRSFLAFWFTNIITHIQTKILRGMIIKTHYLPTWPPSYWVSVHKHWFIVY